MSYIKVVQSDMEQFSRLSKLYIYFKSHEKVILLFSFCILVGFLNFKPSEPYLSQFLTCYPKTVKHSCNQYTIDECNTNYPCLWNGKKCSITPCSNITITECTSNLLNSYCEINAYHQCEAMKCYKTFTEDQVNNDIYPWSTYSYFIFLLTMGPYAEMISYRVAILTGIIGRVLTRLLLLYGTTLGQMQLMQITFSLGSAAEDIFSAYIYSVVNVDSYQQFTSYLKTSGLISHIFAGILGDILVTQYYSSLNILMTISAVAVCTGALVAFILVQPQKKYEHIKNNIPFDSTTTIHHHTNTNIYASYQSFVQYCIQWLYSLITIPTRIYYYCTQENTWSIQKILIRQKLYMLYLQIVFVIKVLAISELRYLTVWFVIGSCIFTIFYGYEVSIYAIFNGGDSWNGSVIATMLLAGCVGAMLPVWLKLELTQKNTTTTMMASTSLSASLSQNDENRHRNTNDINATTITTITEESPITRHHKPTKLMLAIIIAGVISCTFMVIFAYSWTLYVSIPCLVIFFACWQFVSVIYYAKLATHLNQLHTLHSYIHPITFTQMNESSLSSSYSSPSQQHMPSSLSSPSVYKTTSKLCLNESINTHGNTGNPDIDIINPIQASSHLLGDHNKSNNYQELYKNSNQDDDQSRGQLSATYSAQSKSLSLSTPAVLHRHDYETIDLEASSSSLNIPTSPTPLLLNQESRSTSHSSVLLSSTQNNNNNTNNINQNKHITDNPTTTQINQIEDNNNDTSGTTTAEIIIELQPPYSIAVLSVIIMNVFLQVIVQMIFFTYLQYSLYMTSIILVSCLCIATSLFVSVTMYHTIKYYYMRAIAT